jgi:transposase
MAYRYGNRHQRLLLPPSVEEYVPAAAPVRAYDAIVDRLDLGALGLVEDPGKEGCPQYDPRAMLKLLVYGYSYGVRSSRKLERECHYNLSFLWLTGGLQPDHKTIAEFRRRQAGVLAGVLRAVAGVCLEIGLIEGNVLFVDGTGVGADAALGHSWTQAKCARALAQLGERIEALLAACAAADEAEAGTESRVQLRGELATAQGRQAAIEAVLGRLQATGQPSLNTTDGDCVRLRRGGSRAGYNGQAVVDDAHGLVVSGDVVAENNDMQQLTPQLAQAAETLARAPEVICSDAGYVDYETIRQIDRTETDVIVPSPQQAGGREPGPFDKRRFAYDAAADAYRCPAGQVLPFRRTEENGRVRVYEAGAVCRTCPHLGCCTTSRARGRKVRRLAAEEVREALERRFLEPDAQAIYARRKTRVEHPFGHVKHNLGVRRFLLRGLAGVRAEWSLLLAGFNIRRMITLRGVPQLLALPTEF